MAGYTLTNEGIARSRKRKMSVKAEMASIEGYEVLDYLYDHGAATLEEISDHTGLSHGQVVEKLILFMNHGLVEGSSH
jgi:transcription initiation factor IIE alpha subunit